jgi:hypothetical protein
MTTTMPQPHRQTAVTPEHDAKRLPLIVLLLGLALALSLNRADGARPVAVQAGSLP